MLLWSKAYLIAIFSFMLCSSSTMAVRSPLEIRANEFTLIMRSGEVIYRYQFYGGFWLKVAEYLGTPMTQSFKLNSIVFMFHTNSQLDQS